ncbi:MAG: hypothetical protein LBH00_12670 [Planctomycetaceae bacterium]|jgi:hypothetical protein|nr:hypothetical protein [Planctomycetaceae bacterium]
MTAITKYILILSVPVISAGCGLIEHRAAPNIEAPPPYLQPHQSAYEPQSPLSDIRAYHDKNSAQMLQEVHIVRNSEMERLETAGAELEKEQRWQDDYKKTAEKRERWTRWFKKKEKPQELQNETVPHETLMSGKADAISKSLR